MTNKKRVEQICNRSMSYTKNIFGEIEDFSDITDAFADGARWADENPKMTKQDFINNAKEFLKNTFNSRWGENSVYADMDLERLLWEFEKWMA